MQWSSILIWTLTIYTSYQILKIFGVFSFRAGNVKAEEHYRKTKSSKSKFRREERKLDRYSGICNTLGFMYNDRIRDSHIYFIDRLRIESSVLNRKYTPQELRGKYIERLLIAIVLLPLGVISKIFLAPSCFLAYTFVMYQQGFRNEIRYEDNVINEKFCDLFLLMYAQLRRGSNGKLNSVVLSYQNTVNSIGSGKEYRVMSKFVDYFLSNLAIYPDHVAVTKLRDKYKSAMIINFCNLAAQSLQGVDNYDTLLSYKLQLVRRKTDKMEKIKQKLSTYVQYAIYGIYAILGQWVILSMIAKLPSRSMLPF